ncbi:MAG: uracil-DNA glycosylase [Candidatus Daviesbacteria bacterium]|nr:uracil-DNA glycosylase [Candidatus Daviesbacteria bacterium]
MDKAKLLQELKEKAENDSNLPLKETAHNLVFGEGNPEAKIYFLGEAPGRIEDLTGRPFVGPAGKLLDKLLESINLKREDVFITSVLYFRPPDNRNPTPSEIAAFAPYTDQQIEIINPKIIVTLGKFSLNKFLPKAKISEVHGQILKINWQGKERILIPQYHPAAGLRSSEVLEKLKSDLKAI